MNQATQATETKEVKPTRPAAPEGFVYNAEGNLIAQCNIRLMSCVKMPL